jgi:hypothetical protein
VATFPHDGRDLAQLLRVARRRADRTARSIVHRLTGDAIGLAELSGAALPAQAASAVDLFAPRAFTLAVEDAAALAASALTEALRGGSVLVAVADHKGLALGTAVRAMLGSGREGVQLHAVDTSAAPNAKEVEALAVLAEHGAFVLVGKRNDTEIVGFHAADPLLADLVADRIGRAGGVRVLG